MTEKLNYTVQSYNVEHDYHVCVDSHGNKFKIDLMTDLDLPWEEYTRFGKNLVGKKIVVDKIITYLFIASGVKIL